MSVVTNVVLHMPLGLEKCMPEINARIAAGHAGHAQPGFVSCDDKSLASGWYGGSKFLECDLYVAAFNHMRIDALVEIIGAGLDGLDDPSEWGASDVQLIVMEQDDDRFRLISIPQAQPGASISGAGNTAI
jgi:hypothetical protein